MLKKITRLNRFFLLFIFVCLLTSFWACSGGGGGDGEQAKKEEPQPTPLPTPVDPDTQPLFDSVYFKTTHDTFNDRYFFAVRDGKIWAKERINGAKWELINKGTGLPFISNEMVTVDEALEMLNNLFGKILSKKDMEKIIEFYSKIFKKKPDPGPAFNKIVGLTVEYDNGVALTDNGDFLHSTSVRRDIDKLRFRSKWGWPFDMGPGMKALPDAISWTYSNDSADRNKIYKDQNGHYFLCMVSSIFTLSKDGQHIHFTDPWTTSDWGYQIATPFRGKFIAENMAAASSTVFLINKYGDMYSMQSDFDIGGGNPGMMFTYSDDSKIMTNDPKKALLNLESDRRVPDKWMKHPKIKGKITSLISLAFPEGIDVYKDNVNDRIMRVEGMNDAGVLGYYEKRLLGDTWTFYPIPGWRNQGKWLDNKVEDCSEKNLGTTEEVTLDGEIKNAVGMKVSATLEAFNLVAQPAIIKINAGGEEIKLLLHHNFFLRTNVRDNPGADGKPVSLRGQIEIPAEVVESSNPKVQEILKKFFLFNFVFKQKGSVFINARVSPPFYHEEYGILTGIRATPNSVVIKPEILQAKIPIVPVPSLTVMKFGADAEQMDNYTGTPKDDNFDKLMDVLEKSN